MIFLYVQAWLMLTYGALETLRRLALRKALPFAPGRYLFALDLVEAYGEVLELWPLARCRSVSATHTSLKLRFEGARPKTLAIDDRDRAAHVVQQLGVSERAVSGAARRIERGLGCEEDRATMFAVDPFFEARMSDGWASLPRKPPPGSRDDAMARPLPCYLARAEAIALVASLMLGPSIWYTRNLLSEQAIWDDVRSATSSEPLQRYIALGGRHLAEASALLEQREFDEGRGSVTALRAFLEKYSGHEGAKLAMQVLYAHATDETASEAEFHRIAYWSDVLQRYPDLPAKTRAIVDEADRAERRQFDGEQVEVRFYDSDRATQIKAQTVDVVITDLDRVSLRRLLAMWDQVPVRAKQLGLENVSSLAEPSDHHRVVILGSDARVNVKGPGGSGQQTIKIFSYGGAAPSRVTIHAFGQRGADTQARLPFKNFIKSNRTGVPPPREKVTILTAGNLRALDIEGPSGYAQQSVEFKIFVEENMEPARYAEKSYERAASAVRSVAEAAAIRASKNGTHGPAGKPSSGGSSGPKAGSRGGASFGIRRRTNRASKPELLTA